MVESDPNEGESKTLQKSQETMNTDEVTSKRPRNESPDNEKGVQNKKAKIEERSNNEAKTDSNTSQTNGGTHDSNVNGKINDVEDSSKDEKEIKLENEKINDEIVEDSKDADETENVTIEKDEKIKEENENDVKNVKEESKQIIERVEKKSEIEEKSTTKDVSKVGKFANMREYHNLYIL